VCTKYKLNETSSHLFKPRQANYRKFLKFKMCFLKWLWMIWYVTHAHTNCVHLLTDTHSRCTLAHRHTHILIQAVYSHSHTLTLAHTLKQALYTRSHTIAPFMYIMLCTLAHTHAERCKNQKQTEYMQAKCIRFKRKIL
jgi:hypothetical protein